MHRFLSKASQMDDSLAQLVEHNTFNVGVMGSSPMRVTKRAIILANSCPFYLWYPRKNFLGIGDAKHVPNLSIP